MKLSIAIAFALSAASLSAALPIGTRDTMDPALNTFVEKSVGGEALLDSGLYPRGKKPAPPPATPPTGNIPTTWDSNNFNFGSKKPKVQQNAVNSATGVQAALDAHAANFWPNTANAHVNAGFHTSPSDSANHATAQLKDGSGNLIKDSNLNPNAGNPAYPDAGKDHHIYSIAHQDAIKAGKIPPGPNQVTPPPSP